MKRMTLKQMQRAADACNYISDGYGCQTKKQQDIEAQLIRALAWAAFAQGFTYNEATNTVSEPAQ